MKKLYFATVLYAVLGLTAGLYYREITKAEDFTGDTQLSVVHTHLLALGMLFLLIVLLLEKAFALSRTRWFQPFFWIYNAGLLLTVGMMVTHGTMTVYGHEADRMVSDMAGMGHILLTLALIFLFSSLYQAMFSRGSGSAPSPATSPHAAGRAGAEGSADTASGGARTAD